MGFNAIFRNHDDFAVLDFAHKFCADDIKSTGFGTQNVRAIQLAQHEGANAKGIARADEFLVGEGNEGVGALKTAQRINIALNDAYFF